MNKLELVKALQDEAEITKLEAQEVVRLFFDSMSDALAEGDRVEIYRPLIADPKEARKKRVKIKVKVVKLSRATLVATNESPQKRTAAIRAV